MKSDKLLYLNLHIILILIMIQSIVTLTQNKNIKNIDEIISKHLKDVTFNDVLNRTKINNKNTTYEMIDLEDGSNVMNSTTLINSVYQITEVN